MHKKPGIRPFATPHDALVFALNTALIAHRLCEISLEEALAKAMLWVNVSQRLGADWQVNETNRAFYKKRMSRYAQEKRCIKCGKQFEGNTKTCPQCLEKNRVLMQKKTHIATKL